MLGFGILTGMKAVEQAMPHKRHAWLSIDEPAPASQRDGSLPTLALLERLQQLDCRIRRSGTQAQTDSGAIRRRFDLSWIAPADDDPVEQEIDTFVRDSGGGASWSIRE